MSDIVKRLRDADTTRRIGESYADTHERRQRDRDDAADEIERLRAILTPKPLDDSAPKDRELIGVERPPCEGRNYFSFIQWHEDKQRWMSRIGYDWSVNPAPTLWAICGASHYLDPLDFPLLPEEDFEEGDDDDQD